MVQIIDKQQLVFRVAINGKLHYWKGTALFVDSFEPLSAKVKGSTLGWHTAGTFVSYNQLKQLLTEFRKHETPKT